MTDELHTLALDSQEPLTLPTPRLREPLLSPYDLAEFRDALHAPECGFAVDLATVDRWLAQLDAAIAAGTLDPRPSWVIEEEATARRIAEMVLAALRPTSAEVDSPPTSATPPTPRTPAAAMASADRRLRDELVRADDAGMSRREWRAAIKRGDLRARKIGREYVATRADFDEYLAARQVAPAPRARRGRPVDPAEAAVQKALASGALRAVGGGRK